MVRRALCIGCNYPGSKMKLNGCVNDAAVNVALCRDKLGVPMSEIIVLTDEHHPDLRDNAAPTKANIIAGIKKLVSGAQPGDMFYFSYSGHGTQVVDHTGDEEDGMDEAIVPGDYEQTKRVITDDELDAYMVQTLPEGAVLTAIFDCCHSGTILDLEVTESTITGGGGEIQKTKKEKKGKGKEKKEKKEKKPKKGKSTKELKIEFADAGEPKAIDPIMDYVHDELPEPEFCARGMGGPSVFMISGCRDDQTSLDVTLGGKPCGALTNSLQKAFSEGAASGSYEDVFRGACAKMDVLRKSIPQLSQCPMFSYCEGDSPSSMKFCQPGSGGGGGGGGYSSNHPPVAQNDDKKDKKGDKEKKEKGGKEKKEKVKKDKGGKSKDINDSDSDDSSSEEEKGKKDKKEKKGGH